jgi:hypothetical protein
MGTPPPDQTSGPALRRYLDRGFAKDERGYYSEDREAKLVRASVWVGSVVLGIVLAQIVFGVLL